jgi:hypothetical protein
MHDLCAAVSVVARILLAFKVEARLQVPERAASTSLDEA